MAYITLQIHAPGFGIGTANTALSGGATKPEETIRNIINILEGIQGGLTPAEILSLSSSTVAGTISGQTGGTAAFTLNLL